SLITGLHPLSHGVVGNDIRLRTDAPSIAKSLAEIGYRTAYIGKWHLDGPDRGAFTPPGPRRQGFEYWAAANCNHNYFESFYYHDSPDPIWIDCYEPTSQTDIAIDYLSQSQHAAGPFCLFLSWGPPHCPYNHVPSRFREMYDPASIPPRPNAIEPNMEIIAGYYAHITALDWNFGRLMDALDHFGLAHDTLVIFTSDHGDMLFSQGRGWKSKPWAESVIVPFIARWPGVIPASREEDAPFGLVNVTPSLLAIYGSDAPPETEGTAYPDMILGRDGPRPDSTPIYFYTKATNPSPDPWRGVITRDYTYARFADRPWVLYNDADDPYQLRNLVDDPSARTLLNEMQSELDRWLALMNDSFESCEALAGRLGLDTDETGIPGFYYQPEITQEIARRAANRDFRMRRA
ncbi:MAG: sulfatase family protein, partial [Armatimonadota bacterium]